MKKITSSKRLAKVTTGSLLAVVGGVLVANNAQATSVQDLNILGSAGNLRAQIIKSLTENTVVFAENKPQADEEVDEGDEADGEKQGGATDKDKSQEGKTDDSKAGEGKCGEGKCGE